MCIVVDADRQAQLRAQSTRQTASIRAELALVTEITHHGFVRWVHWHNQAKDCGDLLVQTNGNLLFRHALKEIK